MEVNIKSNAKEVSKRIGKKGKELSASIKRALSITAQSGINIIEARTSKGVGFKGGKFKDYTPIYAAFRASKGRGNNPDLQFTGQMLSSMTSRASSKQAEIFFTRATESKKAAMNNKSRPFFGFSRKEEKQLGEVFFRALK
jgi:hypothetical protein|tara:strand:- start:830 stop:1252 length:423 start_codon:yes stop_codon:yes gene_type:complete